MSRVKSKTAILYQTLFTHEFNFGISQRITEMVIINKNQCFISNNNYESCIISFLRKLGIRDDDSKRAIAGEQLDITWRKRNALIRVVKEGELYNLTYRVYAQFYVPGYIRNGYDDEKLVYELFTGLVPSAVVNPTLGDHFSIIYSGPAQELEARFAAGDMILKANSH